MHSIKLSNGSRSFTTISNFPREQVFAKGVSRPWNRIVVLVHGFPDNNYSYTEFIPELEASLGKKTLIVAPLLRGYEVLSQGPFTEYTPNDMAADIKAWIECLDYSNVPVNVLGHDWGAVGTFRALQLYPHLISLAVTLAIPYVTGIARWKLAWAAPQQLYLSSYMLTMQFPLLYRYRFLEASDYLQRLWLYWSPTWKCTDEDLALVKATLDEKTIDHATAYYRCLASIGNLKQFTNYIDFEQTPLLVLGGSQDGCMSRGLFDLGAKEFAHKKGIKVQVVDGVGHFLHREDPKRIAAMALDWFTRSQE